MGEQIDKYFDKLDKNLKLIREGKDHDLSVPQKVKVDIKVNEDW